MRPEGLKAPRLPGIGFDGMCVRVADAEDVVLFLRMNMNSTWVAVDVDEGVGWKSGVRIAWKTKTISFGSFRQLKIRYVQLLEGNPFWENVPLGSVIYCDVPMDRERAGTGGRKWSYESFLAVSKQLRARKNWVELEHGETRVYKYSCQQTHRLPFPLRFYAKRSTDSIAR